MNISMKLKPWVVPNFASVDMPARLRQEGFAPLPSIPIHELTDEALEQMCKEFRDAVFAKKAAALAAKP